MPAADPRSDQVPNHPAQQRDRADRAEPAVRTLDLDHGRRGGIVHALRIAGERFRENAKTIREEIARLRATRAPGRQVEVFNGLAEQMDHQARDAFRSALMLEDAERVTVTGFEPEPEEQDDEERNAAAAATPRGDDAVMQAEACASQAPVLMLGSGGDYRRELGDDGRGHLVDMTG